MKKLRVFVIMDENPFHQPSYLQGLITKCEHINIVGAARVVLPQGGVLQQYLLKNWKLLGLCELVLLGMKTYRLKLKGWLPTIIRGDFEGSVKAVLKKYGIPFRTVSKVNNDSFIRYVASFDPDIILSSNPLVFKQKLISTPKLAAINRHSALLPSYGGVFPAFRAIQFGEKSLGASVHLMTVDIDDGPVLARREFSLTKGDSLDKIYSKAFQLSYDATDEAFAKLRYESPVKPLSNNGFKKSYYSYPSKEDWTQFRRNHGRFI